MKVDGQQADFELEFFSIDPACRGVDVGGQATERKHDPVVHLTYIVKRVVFSLTHLGGKVPRRTLNPARQ